MAYEGIGATYVRLSGSGLLSTLLLMLRLDRFEEVPELWLLARPILGNPWLRLDRSASGVSSSELCTLLWADAAPLPHPPGKWPWLEAILSDGCMVSTGSPRRRRTALAPATINLDSGGGVILSK